MEWAREQARIETEKYKVQKDINTVLIPLCANKKIDYNEEDTGRTL